MRRAAPRIKQPRRGKAASSPCRSLARHRTKTSEAVSSDHEPTGELSVVSGQRFAASSCGARSRICQSVLGARRRPQRRSFVQLGPQRQANSWRASLVSAERFAFVPFHQNQLPQWNSTLHPATAPAMPNPSLKLTPNGIAFWPRTGCRAHFPVRGQNTIPSGAA